MIEHVCQTSKRKVNYFKSPRGEPKHDCMELLCWNTWYLSMASAPENFELFHLTKGTMVGFPQYFLSKPLCVDPVVAGKSGLTFCSTPFT